MLVEFKLKNFRSYKDEQIFSMVASKDDKLSDENTFLPSASGSLRLNRGAVVYGANASGKSNLFYAMAFVRGFVQNSTDMTPNLSPLLHPFAFDDVIRQEPSEFEIVFVHNDIRYQYGFSVDREHVREEWLLAYPKGKAQTWFERTRSEDPNEIHDWYFGPSLKGQKERLRELTRPDSLFITIAAKFAHPQLSSIYKWFVSKFSMVGNPVPSEEKIQFTIELVKQSPLLENRLRELLRYADFGVTDFAYQESPIPISASPEDMNWLPNALDALGVTPRLQVKLQHESSDVEAEDSWLDISQESQGTREFFGIMGYIFEVLHHGGVLAIDELDTSLHPLLVEALVKLFHDTTTNPQNAQLIFNTHDVTLLDLTLFRRDQIWFTEKERSGATTLYSLLEYKPRNDEAILKGYLSGRYGAVPFIDAELELFTNGS